jgi:hypothetical protein
MGKAEAAFYIACVVLLVVPPWFIRHRVYDDGLVGRIFLVVIVLGAFAVLGQAAVTYWDAWRSSPSWPLASGVDWSRAGYHVEGEEAFLAGGFAGFLVWHLWRFHRRVVQCVTPPQDPLGAWPPVRAELSRGWPAEQDELAPRREAQVRARG